MAYAARKTWAFDGVFWGNINERFFGKREGGEQGRRGRLRWLRKEEVKAMDGVGGEEDEGEGGDAG